MEQRQFKWHACALEPEREGPWIVHTQLLRRLAQLRCINAMPGRRSGV